jgi:hypothetical protein
MNQSKNRGFLSSPTAFIRQIRTNLEEGRYERDSTGASILKELLQNADDAGDRGASFVCIGLSKGLTNAKHPLLSAPALYIINDGPFEPHDEQNIRRFGENSKSLDTGKIGKFGLGLKSLFHLCEAFFYLYIVEEDGNPKLRRGFLNPWSSGSMDDIHSEWDVLDKDDILAVYSELRPLIGQSDCFSLWIPLRQQEQLDGHQPISQYFPGDKLPSWFEGKELQSTLATTLPMLQHVKEVRAYVGSGKSAKCLFTLQLSDTSLRRKRVSELECTGTHEFSGAIQANGERLLRYHAIENRLQHHKLCCLHKDDRWPQDLGRDPTTGKVAQVKEKAEQHGACCVSISSCSPGEMGYLTINWAVFLPLNASTTIRLTSPFQVSLLLHSYFFTDAGRNGPLGLVKHTGQPPSYQPHFTEPKLSGVPGEDDGRLIKHKWNYLIAENATLPLLPQVLSKALTEIEGTEGGSLTATITLALFETEFFKQARNAICGRYCMVNRADSAGITSWQLIAKSTPILLLPGLADSMKLAWVAFPQLALLSDDYCLSPCEVPRLCHSESIVRWPIELVIELLQQSNLSEIAKSDQLLNFVIEFIVYMNQQENASVATDAVVDFVRKIFIESEFESLRDRQHIYQKLVRQIPPTSRIAVEAESDAIHILLEEKRSLLFVPKFLEPTDSPCSGRFETAECISLLERIAKSQVIQGHEKHREGLSLVAASVLALAKSKAEVVNQIGDLPVFVASDCRKRKGGETLVSWNQLNRRRENQMLYIKPPNLAYQLQDVLAEESLYLVDSKLFERLFPDVVTKPTCQARQIIAILSRESPPLLMGPIARRSLAEKLLDFQPGLDIDDYRACIRYLLHGSAENARSGSVLLVNNPSVLDIWRRVVHKAMEVNETHWRILDADLSACLSPNRCVELRVQLIDATIAARLIEDKRFADFSGLNPTDDEYVELLRYVNNDELCRKLPIHRTVDGRFVSIDDRCYWESSMQVPVEFSDSVTVLKLSSEPQTMYRQERLAGRLDYLAMLRMAIDSNQPRQYWRLILDALEKVVEPPPDDIIKQLKKTKWILAADGSFICPDELVHLPKLRQEVLLILASSSGNFYEPSQISQQFLCRNGYLQVERLCFPDVVTSFAMMGEVLKEDSRNAIGSIPDSELENWVKTVVDFPVTTLQSAEFIRKASNLYGGNIRSMIAVLGKQELSSARLYEFLFACQELHSRADAIGVRDRALHVYAMYMSMLLRRTGSTDCLRKRTLLNRDGTWVQSNQLAFSNDGIGASFLLHQTLEDTILQFFNEKTDATHATTIMDQGLDFDWSKVDEALSETASKLKSYFRIWESVIPHEQIGGFLSLLGDDAEVSALAQAYLGGNRTIVQTRRKIGIADWRDKNGLLKEDGLTMISKQRVVVEIVSTPKILVKNIFGDTLEADRNLVPSTIFIKYGKPNYPFPQNVIDGKRVLCFRLNEIDTRHVTPTDLSNLLKDSCVKLIGQAYNQYQYQTHFSEAWDDLSNSDQLDISIAQARIISNAFLILEQYGLKSDTKLGPVIREWDAADKLVAEQQVGFAVGNGNRDANKERDVAKAKLRDLLETDTDTQLRIAAAVRQRIEKHYQYTVASIPFEIFQNADDTCSQLDAHFGDRDRSKAARSFLVNRQGGRIVFVHYGRCINQYPLENSKLRPKFEDDLWSMLVLNLSSKSLDDVVEKPAAVTGKYGLGFKSCYLVSDSPRIVSGRLAFEVKGAMYPKRMLDGNTDDSRSIMRLKESLGVNYRHATLIELPLDRAEAFDVLKRFDRLCGLQVVFARHISTIVLSDVCEVSWTPRTISGVRGALVGKITLRQTDGSGEQTTGLLLQNELGSLLLRIDSCGISCFDDEIPTVWVMAPTYECLGTGFIVNGAFNIDVGRAQLSRDLSENERIALRLGELLGEQLVQLYKRSRNQGDWSLLLSELGLAEVTNPYQFFSSLFYVLTNVKATHSSEPGHKLLHDIVWEGDRSLGCVLVSGFAGLPTGLSGDYQQLVAASDVNFTVAGILGERGDVFEIVSSWDSFRSKARPGSVISEKSVARRLGLLKPRLLESASTLRLAEVLAWEIGDNFECDAATAERLGRLVTRQLLVDIDKSGEREHVEKLLKKVKFKSRDGQYQLAVELLCPKLLAYSCDYDFESTEEGNRADFAPSKCLLSDEYQDSALLFFQACRGRMEAPARLLAGWTLEALDASRRTAALNYIARGQLRRQLIQELKQLGWKGTWLEHLATSDVFQALPESERFQLLELIPEDDRPKFTWAIVPAFPQNPVGLPPQDCLRSIHKWWNSVRNEKQSCFNGRSFLEEYEHRTYPSWFRPDESLAESDNRESWMTLLLLGLFHTQGRATTHQHKGFLEQLRKDGWFRLFAEANSDQLRWMQSVDKYLDSKVGDALYLHWMRQFVGIYQLNRHLEDYAEQFLAIQRIRKPFSLDEVTNSQTSTQQQGGGRDTPPLAKQLGLGACFIVRELVRKNVIQTQHAHEHCFVPTRQIRSLFLKLGCEDLEQEVNRWEASRTIYKFLDTHMAAVARDFCNDFDLPFQFIADSVDLQEQLFAEPLEIGDAEEEVDATNWDAFSNDWTD